MMTRLLLAALFATVVSLPSQAANYVWSTEKASVTSLYASTASLLFFLDIPPLVNNPGSTCLGRYFVAASAQNYEVISSVLTSAYFTGHRVLIRYDADSIGCGVSVQALQVSPQ